MYDVVGVRFKKAGKIYYFDPAEHPVSKDQHVIVETARGVEYGKVVVGPKTVGEEDVVLPLKKVIRIAGDPTPKLSRRTATQPRVHLPSDCRKSRITRLR